MFLTRAYLSFSLLRIHNASSFQRLFPKIHRLNNVFLSYYNHNWIQVFEKICMPLYLYTYFLSFFLFSITYWVSEFIKLNQVKKIKLKNFICINIYEIIIFQNCNSNIRYFLAFSIRIIIQVHESSWVYSKEWHTKSFKFLLRMKVDSMWKKKWIHSKYGSWKIKVQKNFSKKEKFR